MDGRMTVLSVMLVSLLQGVSCSDPTYWRHVCSVPNILACPKGYRLLLTGVYEAHTELGCPENLADPVSDIATCSERQIRERRIIRHVNDYCRGANICLVYPLRYAIGGEQILNCSTDSEDTTAFTAYEYRCIVSETVSHVYLGVSKNLTCPEGYTIQLTGAYCVIKRLGCPKNLRDRARRIRHCYSLFADAGNGYIQKKNQICNGSSTCKVSSMSYCETVDPNFMAFGYKCHLAETVSHVYLGASKNLTCPEGYTIQLTGAYCVIKRLGCPKNLRDRPRSIHHCYSLFSTVDPNFMAFGYKCHLDPARIRSKPSVQILDVYDSPERTTTAPRMAETATSSFDGNVHVSRVTSTGATASDNKSSPSCEICSQDNYTGMAVGAGVGGLLVGLVVGAGAVFWFRRHKTESVSNDHPNDVDTTMNHNATTPIPVHPNGHNAADAQHSTDGGDYEDPNIYVKLNSAGNENDCRVYEELKTST